MNIDGRKISFRLIYNFNFCGKEKNILIKSVAYDVIGWLRNWNSITKKVQNGIQVFVISKIESRQNIFG